VKTGADRLSTAAIGSLFTVHFSHLNPATNHFFSGILNSIPQPNGENMMNVRRFPWARTLLVGFGFLGISII